MHSDGGRVIILYAYTQMQHTRYQTYPAWYHPLDAAGKIVCKTKIKRAFFYK